MCEGGKFVLVFWLPTSKGAKMKRTKVQGMHISSGIRYLEYFLLCLNITVLFSLEKRTDSNNRVYFVNHNSRATQWEDPRVSG